MDGSLAVLAPPSAHYSVKRSVAMLGLGERAVVDLEVDAEERTSRAPSAARSSAAAPPAGARWRSWPRRAPPAPGCTTTSRRSARSAASTASGSTWTRHTARPRCCPRPTHICSAGSSTPTRRSGTRTRCCAPRPSPPRSCFGTALLEAAFRQTAAYLIYEESGGEDLSLLERQVECTKAAIGMRIFMNLAFRGEEDRPLRGGQVRPDPPLLGAD